MVVELGGNDGLRGQPVQNVRANLAAILDKIRDAGARALLLGMRIPTSYGPEYTEAFAGVYDELAKERGLPYVPFFMGEIAGKPVPAYWNLGLNLRWDPDGDGLYANVNLSNLLDTEIRYPANELTDFERGLIGPGRIMTATVGWEF